MGGALSAGMLKRGDNLHQTVLNRMRAFPVGSVLDVGTGKGELAITLAGLGYSVKACDLEPKAPWPDRDDIEYRQADLNGGIPYPDADFNYVVCLEIIEHVENPFAFCREIKRVLAAGGRAIVSTPNILRMRSRIQYLLEGSFPQFDLPLIEWDQRGGGGYVHVNPIRWHEMEYYMYKAGLEVEDFFSSERSYAWRLLFPLELVVRLRAWRKAQRFRKRDRTPLARLYSRILSDDLLYGTHLIVCARRPL